MVSYCNTVEKLLSEAMPCVRNTLQQLRQTQPFRESMFVRDWRPYTHRRRSQPDSKELHKIDFDGYQQQEELMEHSVEEAVDIPKS